MNGLITKLNIIKNNTLVKKGQLIYNGFDDLKADDERNIPEGLYIVKSIQLVRSNQGCDENKKKYMHTLDLVGAEYNEEGKLALNSEDYVVSIDKEYLEKNFGIGRTAKKGVFYEYIKNQFEKAGKEGFNSNIDYDSNFTKLGWKIILKWTKRMPKEEGADLMRDMLMESVTQETVKKYDPKRDIFNFFGGVFAHHLNTAMRDWTRHKRKEVDIQDQPGKDDSLLTKEEQLDRLKSEQPSETQEDKVSYKELIKELKKFINKRTRSEGQLKIFDDLLAGYSGRDIAERHDISPSLVTRFTKELRNSIIEYAKKTDNTDLMNLLSIYGKNKKFADNSPSFLVDVFKDYKKKFGTNDLANRELSGEVIKVKKTVLHDKVSDDAIAQVVLNDSYSSKVLKEDLTEYFSLLDDQDELVESKGGRLTGLKVVGDEVRSIQDQAKCKKKKTSKKETGFFVYSKCGLGPHKVLKIDGTFSIKLNKRTPVKIFKSQSQAEKATSRYQHTKLVLKVGTYPDEYLLIKEK